MEMFPIKTKLIKPNEPLVDTILESIERQKLQLRDRDIIAITSKILSYAQNRLVSLNEVKYSEKSVRIAKEVSLKKEMVELILNEADKTFKGVNKAILTLKNRILTPNSGIDNKNAPLGSVILWPENPEEWTQKIREEILTKTGKKIAVLLIDSYLMPLRIGTTSIALAVSGFKPIIDYKGTKDIYGKKVQITSQAVADDLASAAHILMGESIEKVPLVLIRNAPVIFNDKTYGSNEMSISDKRCLFMNSFSIKDQ